MKIAFLGNFSVDYCSEVHYLKTLRKLGHEVITIQEGADSIMGELLEKELLDCDIFFWVHTHGWKTQGLGYALDKIKGMGIPVVGYHLDLWMGIERQKDLENDSYWKWMDYFFSVDQLMVNYLNSKEDMPKAFFLRAGVFEDECYIAEKKAEYKHDVIFVGSRGYHKEWPYREKLISWLETTYGKRFAHYGGGGLPTKRGSELNALYASAKIIIGDTLCKNFDYPYYLSDRIFETTGRGGFIIHPYITGIEMSFKLGDKDDSGLHYLKDTREIATYKFNNFDYLKYQIDYFLKNEEEREWIRLRGHERTKRDHTYTNRLTEILNIVQNEKESK